MRNLLPALVLLASIDPAGDGCALRFTEIRYSDTRKEYERLAVEGAEVKACAK